MAGILRVVSTPIGNLADLSPRAADALRDADLVLAEDTRRTGRLLAHVASSAPQRSLHEHNEVERIADVLELIATGMTVVLVSDAGTPAVSDPGFRLLAAAADEGVVIEPIPGPSAVMAALVASGLPTDRVAFEGFLPRKGAPRTERLAALREEVRTMVLFVAPHRSLADLEDLSRTLGHDRRAVIARELTKMHEEIVRGTLEQLASRAEQGLRGELTVVVAGASRQAEPRPPDGELIELVRMEIARGLSKKEAIKTVAVRAGVPRREVYQLVIDASS